MEPIAAAPGPDRRKTRTRQEILEAMRRMIFTRRYRHIRTAALIEAAGVGRSTFYEHFRSKDEVLIALLDPLFSPLADAAAGYGNVFAVEAVLVHLWEQRAGARVLFEPPLGDRLGRKLMGMIEARTRGGGLETPSALAAIGAAAATLAVLRAWLGGEVSASAGAVARHLVAVKDRTS